MEEVKSFVERESYLHKYAKELLYKWLNESEELLSFSKSNLYMEYPICINEKINTWSYEWWQYNKNTNNFDNDGYLKYVPTYEECIEMHKCIPIAIIDIVCVHKGLPYIAVEVVHKNKVSDEKLKKLNDIKIQKVIEIDAYWILSQIEKPKQLKYRTLIDIFQIL